MNRFVSLAAVLVVACLMQGCAAGGGEGADRMIDASKKLDRRFAEAFSKGDVDGVMACYWHSPELVVYPPGAMQAKGWEATRDAIVAALKAMPGGRLELVSPHYMVVGDAIVGWGLWKISFPKSNGAEPDVLGRYTEVVMNKDGQWVLIHDHPSVAMPPPPTTASKP